MDEPSIILQEDSSAILQEDSAKIRQEIQWASLENFKSVSVAGSGMWVSERVK